MLGCIGVQVGNDVFCLKKVQEGPIKEDGFILSDGLTLKDINVSTI